MYSNLDACSGSVLSPIAELSADDASMVLRALVDRSTDRISRDFSGVVNLYGGNSTENRSKALARSLRGCRR